ncbi:MAG: TRAP transporter substrate-binding protein [Hyphomicrobiales bacterium]|nr:TRAP transporter substrate-binding protein [Hyphomicrobiales bacterium]
MRRNLFRLALTLAVLVMLPLPFAGGAKAADVTLKIAHVAPPTASFQINAERFGKHLKEMSGGTMEVEVIGGGALGNLVQLWAQLRAGTLDMHVIDIGAMLPMKEARNFFIIVMPYLFRDQTHWHTFLASDTFKDMMGKVEEGTGIKFVGPLGDRPPRALTTKNTPVKTPADLKGLKVRTPLNPAITGVFKAWGASPTPVKASELYSALQSGLVDGQDNGIAAVVQAAYYEVQKYYMPIDYMRTGIGLWMSGTRWASLTDQQKGWVMAAATAANKEANDAFPQEYETWMATAKAKGMEIVQPDIEAFRAAAQPMIQGMEGKAWPAGLYDKIHGMK